MTSPSKMIGLKISAAVVALVTATSLAACGSDAKSEAASADAPSFKIVASQFVTHDSLDAITEGFKAALADEGLKVEYDNQNANGDQNVVAAISGAAASSNADLILAVATPMAQGVAQAVTDTPVVFAGITDPVGAGLVESFDEPGANVTGVSDKSPVDAQAGLIADVLPEAKTIGIIHSAGEVNSEIQAGWMTDAAEKLGMTTQIATATNTSEIQQAANSLDVDAIFIPTDSTVISALDSVLQVAETKKIPVFTSDGDSVRNGSIASYSFAYWDLGYQAGEMAARILRDGADPATTPVETVAEPILYVNEEAAARMGIKIPSAILEQALPENRY